MVKIVPDSSLHKLDANAARVIALRVHPEYAALQAGGRGKQDGKAAPPGAEGRGADGGFAGRGGGRGAAGADLQQMIDRSPAVMISELKNGDAIVVMGTLGANAVRVTAITLVAGVEPILTKPGTREMSLGSWNLEAGGGGEQ